MEIVQCRALWPHGPEVISVALAYQERSREEVGKVVAALVAGPQIGDFDAEATAAVDGGNVNQGEEFIGEALVFPGDHVRVGGMVVGDADEMLVECLLVGEIIDIDDAVRGGLVVVDVGGTADHGDGTDNKSLPEFLGDVIFEDGVLKGEREEIRSQCGDFVLAGRAVDLGLLAVVKAAAVGVGVWIETQKLLQEAQAASRVVAVGDERRGKVMRVLFAPSRFTRTSSAAKRTTATPCVASHPVRRRSCAIWSG